MKSQSLCELMECAENIFRANAELARRAEGLAPSRDEKPAKEQFFLFDYGGERYYLPKEEIGACNRLIGYCNAYNSAYNAPLLQFKLQIAGNHVKEVRMLGAAIAPSPLLDLPALEKINVPWSPSGYPFPSNHVLKDLAHEGITVVVGGKSDSGLAEIVEPQGERTAVSGKQDPKTKQPYDFLRSVVNISERYYENSAQPVEVKNALDRVKSILEPLEKDGSVSRHSHLPVLIDTKDFELIMRSVNSYEKHGHTGLEHKVAGGEDGHTIGRAGRWFVNSCVATVGLCFAFATGWGIGKLFLGGNNPRQEIVRTVEKQETGIPVIEQRPESSTSIGSMEYKGLSYTVPYHETIAFDSVRKYDPEIVIKKQECSACDGRSRANPHHIDVHNIESIIIKGKPLDKIPDMMTGLKKLKLLEISESQIADVSPLYSSFARNLQALETLKLNNNRLTSLESNLCELPSLKEVWITNNPIDWSSPANKDALQKLEAKGVKVYR